MQQHPFLNRLRATDPVRRSGRLCSILPTALEAEGPSVPLGTLCHIATRDSRHDLMAEVVRVDRDRVVLTPLGDPTLTFAGAMVTAATELRDVPVGDALLGRAVNAFGQPIDGKELQVFGRHPLYGKAVDPFARSSPQSIIETGIRAIDGLLTLGHGQRVGVFAASGVGKTSLISQIVSSTRINRRVICLIGERGREVETMWNEGLSDETRANSVLIAATSDESAAVRVRCGHYALAISDYWRSQGQNVLLVMDSITRLAMAMREIGLAAGEPPTIRAYTPSVFAAIPKMVERCGAMQAGGSITAIFTVLTETDDVDDPIAEVMKSLLDGHIILSRPLAEQGHFPAVDVVRSVSRRAEALMSEHHWRDTTRMRALLAQYEASRTLIQAGLYNAGSNAELDAALAARESMLQFLRQGSKERTGFDMTRQLLAELIREATLDVPYTR